METSASKKHSYTDSMLVRMPLTEVRNLPLPQEEIDRLIGKRGRAMSRNNTRRFRERHGPYGFNGRFQISEKVLLDTLGLTEDEFVRLTPKETRSLCRTFYIDEQTGMDHRHRIRNRKRHLGLRKEAKRDGTHRTPQSPPPLPKFPSSLDHRPIPAQEFHLAYPSPPPAHWSPRTETCLTLDESDTYVYPFGTEPTTVPGTDEGDTCQFASISETVEVYPSYLQAQDEVNFDRLLGVDETLDAIKQYIDAHIEQNLCQRA